MDDKMKLLLFCVFIAMTTSCSSLSALDNDSLNSEIGWLHGNCLAIKNAEIPPGYQFMLVNLDNENTIENSTIIEKTTNSEDCYPLLDDRADINKDAGYSFYSVKSKKPVGLAIGLLRPEEISVSEVKFSYCNTTEGIEFSISKSSSEIWKGYYYLGYESEPTCPSE